MPWKTKLAALLVCLCGAGTASAELVQYRIIDLGTIADISGVDVRGMNNRGLAAGMVRTRESPFASSFTHAAIFNGGLIELLPDSGTHKDDTALAWDINDTGDVGGYYRPRTASYNRPALWDDGLLVPAHMLPGGAEGQVRSLSDELDWVGVGFSATSVTGGPNQNRATMWNKNGTIKHNLGTLATTTEFVSSVANDVNKHQQVVGVSGTDGGVSRAFLWQDGQPMQNLGTLGGASEAWGINDLTHVVGASNNMAFYWSSATGMIPVGSSNTSAAAINNSDVICGVKLGRAAVGFGPSEPMVQLSTLLTPDSTGWTLYNANDINERWQIVGVGTNAFGQNRAYLAVPVPLNTTNTIPAGASTFAAPGDLAGWTPTGAGSASVIADPNDATNYVMSLVTGSPILVDQTVDTPAGAFAIGFDYRFLTVTGTLTVSVDGVEVASLDAPDWVFDQYTPYSLIVDQPELLGLNDVPLTFSLDGPTGSQVLLDNITLTELVPEPASLALLACGALALIRRR